MNGRITRLLDNKQSGFIAGDDGQEYHFSESALRGVSFYQLSLGTAVTFMAGSAARALRAESVQIAKAT